MPPVTEQLQIPESITNPEFAGARFLLKPGRKYQDAVDFFSPYSEVKEPNPDAKKRWRSAHRWSRTQEDPAPALPIRE